jgi:hypothetical protein
MARVATTVTERIVFYKELDTVLRDEAGFAGVTQCTGTTGPWDVAGSTRLVHLSDGTTCRETVKTSTAPDYFAYRLTEFSSRAVGGLTREATGQWWFTDDGSGTHAKWTYTAESRTILALPILFPVIKILWHRYMRAAMARVKARAEKEVMRAR